jgi:hypothetical protein
METRTAEELVPLQDAEIRRLRAQLAASEARIAELEATIREITGT